MNKTISDLKENNDDFEFYPTTDEIISTLHCDIEKSFKSNSHYALNKIDLLDIGSGDGRVLNMNKELMTINKFGVEKSVYNAEKLIKDGVFLLGRDYFNISLMDKKFDVVYSNPPYSIFKEWCLKMLSEVSSQYIYLCIPTRWKEDEMFVDTLNSKGNIEILGEFDFLGADRKARAVVNLIRVKCNNDDVFSSWVEKNIGEFKSKNVEFEDKKKYSGLGKKLTLVEQYNNEMSKLLDMYKQIAEMDFSILENIGVNYNLVLDRIKIDVSQLKNKYWRMALDNIEPIKKRLTHKSRKIIFYDIGKFSELDFNEDNIENIVFYVIENFNIYSEKQLLGLFDTLTGFGNFSAYKSNEKWIKNTWRYEKMCDGKGKPEKLQLDYRIIAEYCAIKRSNDWEIGRGHAGDIIEDISIVLRSLGYRNNGLPEIIERGKPYYMFDTNGIELVKIKVFKKGSCHFQFNQQVMMKLNIEVAKINKWFKCSEDVADEFNISKDEAMKYFCDNGLKLMENSQFLIN